MPIEFDILIVGGSFAGLSAALQVARARRRVAVVDAGRRRNRFAATSHGFLGQDGRPPGDIVADARAQLLAYPTVQWIEGAATQARALDDGFQVSVSGHEPLQARRIVLATGVVDELPEVEGLAERWGRSVFHCPYCHGYELGSGRIGVLAAGPMSVHQAMLLPDWGATTLIGIGDFLPDDAACEALARRGVVIERAPVRRVTGEATVELADGRQLAFDGLFTLTRTRMGSSLPEQLGCAFDEGPVGPFVRRNETFETTVPGVFACGDAARPFGNVAVAVGDGAMVGAAAHRSLVFTS